MSGGVDEDVRRSMANGRRTLGAMLSSAQSDLQKVFVVFLVGFLGTFYALQLYIWDFLKKDLLSGVATVNALTPADVPLLQAKIGIIMGIIVALPAFLYFGRDALKARGVWPEIDANWKIAVIALLAVVLALGGAAYGYYVFLPVMFGFLASNAASAGIQPNYSIVKWAQFVFQMVISFALAAQLPLAMTGLSLSGIVPYETFRDKWKYAVVLTFVFGMVFSPPDPFTQIMWAAPLVGLYAISLGLAKFLVTLQRGSEGIEFRAVARKRRRLVFGVPTLAALVVVSLLGGGVVTYVDRELLSRLPYIGPATPLFPNVQSVLGVSRPVAIVAVVIAVVVVSWAIAFVYAIYQAAERRATEDWAFGDPRTIDLAELDAAGLRSAPIEAFAALGEEEVLERAQTAIDNDEPERAQAYFDRFEEARERDAEEANEGTESSADGTESSADGTEGSAGGAANGATANEGGSTVTRTTAGMVNAFTAEETTEDDIGGYYYDIAFVLNSLRSRAFLLVGLFGIVLAGGFIGLSRGGLSALKSDFLARLPAGVPIEDVNVVALHPVEALVFEVKLSTILAAIVVLPFVLYYAWPALKSRGVARGDRRVLLIWAGALFVGLGGGTVLGYTVVAPRIISWLAADALTADMIVGYRIGAAGWLVVMTTAGVGVLGMVPISMVLFHASGILPYGPLFGRWREVTVAVFGATALFAPKGVFMMFILGIPIMVAYGIGLAIIWLYTLGGRRGRSKGRVQSAD